MTDRHTDLSAAEKEVLKSMFDEQRVNSHLLSERTSLSEDEIQTTLHRLTDAGLIERVSQDLYEVDEASRNEIPDRGTQKGIPDPNPETQTAPIDPTDFEESDDE